MGSATASQAAGTQAFVATLLWVSHQALAVPLTWSSAYNQILVTFFFLLAFTFLLRWITHRRLADWIAQWGAFILGFGALETMVVYPILATAFCVLFAPDQMRRSLWLWPASLLYTALRWNAVSGAGGVYALHFDIGTITTAMRYCAWALGHPTLGLALPVSHIVLKIGSLSLAIALAAFVVAKTRRRQWLAVFLVLWFMITLAPYVPLTDHVIGYYLTLPSIGLCLLGGWAAVEAWSTSASRRVLAVGAMATYLVPSIALARLTVANYIDRGLRTHQLIDDLRAVERRQPDKVLLLRGVTQELFAETIHHRPFERLEISTEVYLALALNNEEWANDPEVLAQTYPAEATLQSIRLGDARVLDVGASPIEDVTDEYFQQAVLRFPAGEPRRVEVAKESFSRYLEGDWYPTTEGCRWTAGRAGVLMARPAVTGETLTIQGFVPPVQLAAGEPSISVEIEGRLLPGGTATLPAGAFDLDFALPPQLAGEGSMIVFIAPGRTFRSPGDQRDLGVCLTLFEVGE